MDGIEGIRDWLLLVRAPRLGPKRLLALINRFGSPQQILETKHAVLKQAGVSDETLAYLESPDRRRIDADLSWLEHPDHHLLSCLDKDYPPQLRNLENAPPVLFVKGDPSLLWLPQLAIIGSRNATGGGLRNAQNFARLAVASGLAVTSGLALGIDGQAHQGALQAGGKTIAVAGTGLDRIYPAKHHELAASLVESGAMVSEFPPGSGPDSWHFPLRNRVISGLSVATLVVEASVDSGSLITARCAIEQGRDVFAIPGSIHNPLARGCHQLIKQGAKLVESGEDLMRELASQVQSLAKEHRLKLPASNINQAIEEEEEDPNLEADDDYSKLMSVIGYDPVNIDQLVEQTGLTPQAVSSMLLILELSNQVQTVAGGNYCLTDKERP